jgi:hypothetical protein
MTSVASRGRFTAASGQIWATVRAEIVMQWRRWGFWASFAFIGALLLLLTVQSAGFLRHVPENYFMQQTPTESQLENLIVYGSTAYGALLLGLVVALLVADRIERDRRLGMIELQRATPLGNGSYVLGKFFGNYAAVLVPMLLTYVICPLVALPFGWSPLLIPKFVLAFLLVAVPCSVAGMGLIILLASWLPLRIVQAGFVLLWFELYIGLGWHGLAASVLNIGGAYIYPVFFPLPAMPSVMELEVSARMAVLNISALLLTGSAALALTYGSLTFQRHRTERV